MNEKEKGKQDTINEGYPVYMDSEYCKNFIEKNKDCEKCEYSFACNRVLFNILRNSVNLIREVLIENGNLLEDINSDECKNYRILNNSCNKCINNEKCYFIALMKFKEMKDF